MTAKQPDDPDPETFRSWIRPRDALDGLEPMGRPAAAREVHRRLKTGLLWAAGSVGDTSNFRAENDLRSVVPALWWGHVEYVSEPGAEFWRTGGATLIVPNRNTMVTTFNTYEHFGIRFEPNGLRRIADDAGIALAFSAQTMPDASLAGDSARTSTPPRLIDMDSLPNKGGRPRAEFWDDMLLAVAKSIYDGDFKPRNQADVTRAMQDWIADHGYEGGLTQIKAMASKAFNTFK